MPSFNEALTFIVSQGPDRLLRILRSTRNRDRLDRPFLATLRKRLAEPPRTPGRLLRAAPVQDGACFDFEQAALEIIFLAEDMVRVSWKPGLEPLPYALVRAPDFAAGIETRPPGVKATLQGDKLTSPLLEVQVAPDGALGFWRGGLLLHQQVAPVFRGEGPAAAWTSQARLRPEEALFGLGEHVRSFNLRGSTHRLWNTDPGGRYGPAADPIYMPLPVIMGLHSQGSYLTFYENPFPADFSCTPADLEAGEYQLQFEGGMLRYYFITGAPDRLLERYTGLTGRPGLPPLWSLGYHQSRWGYKSAADIRQVAAGFREHNLPLSAISMDIDYMRGYRVFTVDPERFPDLPGLARELADHGIHLVTIIDPGVKVDPSYEVYRQGLEIGAFCKEPDGRLAQGVVWPGWAAFPDFTDPAARDWWAGLYQPLFEAGISGIWHDMNEPPSFSAWGETRLSLAVKHNLEGSGGDHHQAHNLYGFLMNRAGWEGQRRLRPERRPWLISRSGWAGQQRYAWNWTADTEASWKGLRMTLRTILGTSLSGQPYNGPDIGGFSGNPEAELYLRWFQLATFLPFFRTHSATGTARREPWVYGETYTTIIREHLRLRYRLLPYLYTLAWQASQSGAPLVRPLFWAQPENPALWEIDDAFLLGDQLLVAPAWEPGQIKRTVLLPPGQWVDLWTDTCYSGGTEVTLPVSLERLPVLVRLGSVLPLGKDTPPEIGDQENTTLHLHVYPPRPEELATEGEILAGELFSDAGDGYDTGRVDRFFLRHTAQGWEVTRQEQAHYPFPFSEVRVYWHTDISPITRPSQDGLKPASVPSRRWEDLSQPLQSD